MREDGAILITVTVEPEEQEEARWGGLGKLMEVPSMLVGQAGRKLLRGPPQAPLILDLPAPSGPGGQDTVMAATLKEEEEAMGGGVEGEGDICLEEEVAPRTPFLLPRASRTPKGRMLLNSVSCTSQPRVAARATCYTKERVLWAVLKEHTKPPQRAFLVTQATVRRAQEPSGPIAQLVQYVQLAIPAPVALAELSVQTDAQYAH